MQIFSWNDILTSLNTGNSILFFEQSSGISVGSFDGLHKGHKVLINTLVNECKKNNLLSGIVTFTRSLTNVKKNIDSVNDILTLEERLKLLEKLNVDFVIVIDFTEKVAEMSGNQFFDILVSVCKMKFLCEGVDFKCGYKGAFDRTAIEQYCTDKNIILKLIELVNYEVNGKQERISSSVIRSLIAHGNKDLASELLDRKE